MIKAAIFATIVSLSVAFSQNVAAQPHYGAVAVVGGQGRDYHGVGLGNSPDEATENALSKCANDRCKIVRDYGPGQCIHMVLGTRQVWWNERLFSSRERQFVIEDCKKEDSKCKVIYSQCLPE